MSATNTSPRIGDVAYIYPGCDKTPTTCKNKFNNFSRNRATPYVPLKETIEGFKAIIDGEMDQVPELAFFNVGNLDDVKKKAESLKS